MALKYWKKSCLTGWSRKMKKKTSFMLFSSANHFQFFILFCHSRSHLENNRTLWIYFHDASFLWKNSDFLVLLWPACWHERPVRLDCFYYASCPWDHGFRWKKEKVPEEEKMDGFHFGKWGRRRGRSSASETYSTNLLWISILKFDFHF